MSFAFQAFLLLIAYLPGALFMLALTGRLSKDQEVPVIANSMTGRAAVGMVFAGLFHTAWLVAVFLLSLLPQAGFRPMAAEFFTLLSAAQQAPAYSKAVLDVRANLGGHAAYFLTIWVGAATLGSAMRTLIKRRQLERRLRWLRFNPSWHYILCGDDYESAGTAKVTVMADLLTQVGEHQVLYSGVISRYWFDDKTGELQVIVLEGAERLTAAFTGAPATVSPPLPISGHILALPVKDIKNFNIVYLTQ